MSSTPLAVKRIDKMSEVADEKFRGTFGDKARPVAQQISMDVKPLMDEVYDRIRSGKLSISELHVLLSKMTIVVASSTIMAIETFGMRGAPE